MIVGFLMSFAVGGGVHLFLPLIAPQGASVAAAAEMGGGAINERTSGSMVTKPTSLILTQGPAGGQLSTAERCYTSGAWLRDKERFEGEMERRVDSAKKHVFRILEAYENE